MSLGALLETFIPALDEASARSVADGRTLSDVELASLQSSGNSEAAVAGFEAALGLVLEREALALRLVLRLLETRIGTWALTGYAAPGGLCGLSLEDRERAVLGMIRSRLAPRRKIANALKRLCIAVLLTAKDANGTNPHWACAGFKTPECFAREEPPAEAAFDWPIRDVDECDVVVVGSGCGGSVCAARLAEAGLRVVVVEKGEAVAPRDMNGDEGVAFKRFYERGGLVSNVSGSIGILAGATLGGGSAINWACCLRTPQSVQLEWAKWGLDFCGDGRFDKALDRVCERLHVQSEKVVFNEPNAALHRGCRALGLDCDVAPQNMKETQSDKAYYIAFGDRWAIKQSTLLTYLRDAAKTGKCSFVTGTTVEKVIREIGRAAGVVCRRGDDVLHIRAKAVVVACGSLNSPCLLQRSKVPNRHIGRHLRLHPVTPCVAYFENRDSDDFFGIGRGAPMTAVSRACAGEPHGCLLEVPQTGLGLAFAAFPWMGGRAFKRSLLRARDVASIIVLQRDSGMGGTVVNDKHGRPVVDYSLDAHDKRSMAHGLATAARVFAAAGATRVETLHTFDPESADLPNDTTARDARVRDLASMIKRRGIDDDNTVCLLSAHQMGTCRMGADPATSVVDTRGQSWELPGLYVCDASLFPSASGVNPMLTTMALATIVSDELATTLLSGEGDDDPQRLARWSRAVRKQLALRVGLGLAAGLGLLLLFRLRLV